MRMNHKFPKILHYTIEFLLFVVWVILFFFPEYTAARSFQIFFLVSMASAMIYSFCRKKYFLNQQYCKSEKVVAGFLIVVLLLKLIFLR